jgi:hypothetical protein
MMLYPCCLKVQRSCTKHNILQRPVITLNIHTDKVGIKMSFVEAKMLKFTEFITRSNQQCQADTYNDAKLPNTVTGIRTTTA